jgi:hypothetical protein
LGLSWMIGRMKGTILTGFWVLEGHNSVELRSTLHTADLAGKSNPGS